MRIQIAPLLFALAACSQPMALARAKVTLPEIAGNPVAPAATAAKDGDLHADAKSVPRPAVAAATMTRVPDARLTEDEVFGEVRRLFALAGKPGLRALTPGTTLVERLRYCYGRWLLKRNAEVLPELERLAETHAANPLVWRLTGMSQWAAKQHGKAVASTRRSFDLAASTGFADCPSLPSFFGELLMLRDETVAEGIKVLRQELAAGAHPAIAARALADHFHRIEQHGEALACVDAGLARVPEMSRLRVLKAMLLYDTCRVEECVRLLQPLVEADDADPLAIEWLMRSYWIVDGYDKTIQLLDRLMAADNVGEKAKTEYRGIREQALTASKVGRRERYSFREYCAILRGHQNVAQRMGVLMRLGRSKSPIVVARALRIAGNSDVAALRARSLQIQVVRSVQPLADLRSGFSDPDAKVRAAAADLAGQLDVDRAKQTSLVLEFLPKEDDSYAFREMHASLNKLTGAGIELPYGAASDPKQRRDLAQKWSQHR